MMMGRGFEVTEIKTWRRQARDDLRVEASDVTEGIPDFHMLTDLLGLVPFSAD